MLNEFDRNYRPDVSVNKKRPAKTTDVKRLKKKKATEAKVLGISEFPNTSCVDSVHESPLQLFEANELGQQEVINPHASTPRCNQLPDLEFTTPAPRVETPPPTLTPHTLSVADVKLIVDEKLRSVDKPDRDYQQLVRRVIECETRQQTYQNDVNRRITQLEVQLQARENEIAELKASAQASRTVLKVRPDLSDITLTQLDAERVHEYDSEVPKQALSPDRLTKIHTFSNTKRIFVANVARQMYSMEERVRDCNISGAKNRPALSPAKSRFHSICYYTSEKYNCPNNAILQRDVTRTIDDTNRRYRDDLKIRKYKRNSVAGTIVEANSEYDQ